MPEQLSPYFHAPPRLVTIPSDDRAFHEHVRGTVERHRLEGPAALQHRLARLFPRVVVRARELSGEPRTWYVYRDGAWRGGHDERWWEGPIVPRLVVGPDGWVRDANAAARSLLGIAPDEPRHSADFLNPGSAEEASALFAVLLEGHPLTATVLARPSSGDTIACEVHVEPGEEGLIAWLRLADDLEVAPVPASPKPSVRSEPADDVVFTASVQRAVERMPEPTPEGLAIRLRRLFPHAHVEVGEEGWLARRDGRVRQPIDGAWWQDGSLARVRYDGEGFILEANEAAEAMLGQRLPGHHWQELVTPGSQDQVAQVLAVIREADEAVSRFRMPVADGSLLEFDSHTRADGDEFVTTMRPIAGPSGAQAS
jgi:PAS domain-containing protein